MRTRLLRRAFIGALALTLIGGTAAIADNTVPDGDGTTPVVANTLNLGTVCLGSTAQDTVLIAISREGNYANAQVFKKETTAKVSVTSVIGAGLSASVAAGSDTIAVPANWDTATNGTMSPSVTSNVTFVAGGVPLSFSGTINYRSTGVDAGGKALTRDGTLAVTATVATCNTPPTITLNDATLQGNILGGRTLTFSDIGSATDAEDGTPSVACTPSLDTVLPLGPTTVTCTATDSNGRTATDSGLVTVEDTVAPSLTGMPPSATVEASSAGGATFTYATPTASDVVWGAVGVSCVPASGSVFPLGASTVTCTTKDGSGNAAAAQFVVNVQDRTAPVITAEDIEVEGNMLGGANVTFPLPTATDAVDGDAQVTCDKTSGSYFPLGSTVVTCKSSDSANNTNTAAFVVTVVDTKAPVITASDVTVEGNAPGGANVTLPTPTATDIVDGSTTVTCDKNSGAFFPLGTTTVNCQTSDESGNTAEEAFSVTVEDTTAPSLVGMPDDVTVEGNTAGGATFAYTKPTATDTVDPNPSVSCSPASGTFLLGSTTVTCTATDSSANATDASFTVNVVDTTAPVITYTGRSPAANASGWNNTNVQVTWGCDDAVSGVVAETLSKTVSTEGENQSATGTCLDKSGNEATNSVTGVNIDKTAPVLGISGAASGESNACSIPARPSFAPTDGLSGIAPTPSDTWTPPGTASGVGTYTYTATATDQAGNTATDTRTSTVTYGSAFGGFLQPVNSDGTSRFKLGSTVPVKFQLTCGGIPMTNAIVKLTVKRADGTPDPGTDEAISTAASTTGNLFRYSDAQYIFNLSTKVGYTNSGSTTPVSFTPGSWSVSALLDDGTYRSVNIQLTK